MALRGITRHAMLLVPGCTDSAQ